MIVARLKGGPLHSASVELIDDVREFNPIGLTDEEGVYVRNEERWMRNPSAHPDTTFYDFDWNGEP